MRPFHKAVKADLEVKRPAMDKLCSMSQDLLSSVKNKDVASKLEARLDSFAQRWDRLIQSLEMSSSQVSHTYCAMVHQSARPSSRKVDLEYLQDLSGFA